MIDRQTLCTLGLVTLLSTSLAWAQRTPAQAGPPEISSGDAIAAKLHPALLRRFDQSAEPVKTWVFFADKGINSTEQYERAINAVTANYNAHAIQRRTLRGPGARGGALFGERDLPVATSYIEAVTATGARLHVTSRWLNAISVYATREQAGLITALPCVARLEAVAHARRIEPVDLRPVEPPAQPTGGERGERVDYGLSTVQLEQINLLALHDAGYTGQGVIVGILDTGFERSHAAFNFGLHALNVIAEYDFVDDDGNTQIEPGDPSSQHNHGTLILGCLGAYKPGELVGGAYDASFVLAKTEDTTGEYPAEEDNYVAGLEFLEANGVDMQTSSLGYIDWYTQADLDGQTAVTTIAVNISTSLGIHHCNAAGNEYHDSNPSTSSLIAPSDAFQVITCGAVESSGEIAGFSSDGPTADGRVKPELLALGSGTDTVDPYSTTGYTTASGTSLSTPLVACAVACLIEARPYWTVDQMREHLFETADYYVEHGTYDPLYVYGYGVVNAFAANDICTDAGVVMLDSGKYPCESTASILVNDCGLNTDDGFVEQVLVAIDSDSETGVEQVTLTETASDSAEFIGTIDLSTTNGAAILLVTDADTITVTYIDDDDGAGGYGVAVTATAVVDCTPPIVSNVTAVNVTSSSAQVSFETNEPARATVYYGLSCATLDNEVSVTTYNTAQTLPVAGLAQNTRYYYAVQAEDEAGNATYDDAGGACYSFRTAHGPQAVFAFPLDEDPGWPTAGEWDFGVPTGQGGTSWGNPDPTSGATGDNVYGVNLEGDYSTSSGGPYYLTLGPLDLTDVSEVSLRFQRWLNTDYQSYVFATIEVSDNGTSWSPVWDNGSSSITDSAWTQFVYDVSATADGDTNVYVRWGYEIGSGAWAYSGWNIDDIEIWGTMPVAAIGDMNCDDLVNSFDIDPFVLALTDPAGYAAAYPACDLLNGDINEDGLVNSFDIDPFVDLLTGD